MNGASRQTFAGSLSRLLNRKSQASLLFKFWKDWTLTLVYVGFSCHGPFVQMTLLLRKADNNWVSKQ